MSDDSSSRQQQQQPVQQRKRQKPHWQDAVAGAFAGAFSRTVMAPVERVKLLKQLQGTITMGGKQQQSQLRQSAWQVARTVYKEQGLRSFWRGNIPNVLRVSGTSAINFTCMDYYKRAAVAPWLDQHFLIKRYQTRTEAVRQNIERKRKLLSSFVSGGLAGATATTVLYPVEFLRTRLAMDIGGSTTLKEREFNGMADVLKRILKSDGVLGLYQGYGIALTGGIFYRLILLGGYDAIKGELLFRKEGDEQLTWVERIASAQFISLTAGTASYPFDSVRRRMMMQAGRPKDERHYRNSVDCIGKVFRAEGIRGFYLGLGPNIFRSVGGALLLVGYDSVKNVLIK